MSGFEVSKNWPGSYILGSGVSKNWPGSSVSGSGVSKNLPGSSISGSGVSKKGWMSRRETTRGRVRSGWFPPKCLNVIRIDLRS